ncbi:MAG: hypothetical protein WCK33_04240 [Phycisphaerae bacterium]
MLASQFSPPSTVRRMGSVRSNTLGLSGLALKQVHAALDAVDTQTERNNARAYARVSVRYASVSVCIEQSGGCRNELLMAGRNLSRGGVSLLHSGFIHDGTKCIVRLPLKSSLVVSFRGSVVRCTHRGGTLHEIGIKFVRPLDQHVFEDVVVR